MGIKVMTCDGWVRGDDNHSAYDRTTRFALADHFAGPAHLPNLANH